jgi:circadian clock protein KaiB
VADTTPRSVLATENLQSFCEEYLPGRYRVTIIDIVRQPTLAREHEILATPTLIRVLPGPERTVVGSLSDTERVLRLLDVGDPPENYVSLLASHVGADAFVRPATRSELPQEEPVYSAPGRMRPGLRVSPMGHA